jgi:hypothetical protein
VLLLEYLEGVNYLLPLIEYGERNDKGRKEGKDIQVLKG